MLGPMDTRDRAGPSLLPMLGFAAATIAVGTLAGTLAIFLYLASQGAGDWSLLLGIPGAIAAFQAAVVVLVIFTVAMSLLGWRGWANWGTAPVCAVAAVASGLYQPFGLTPLLIKALHADMQALIFVLCVAFVLAAWRLYLRRQLVA